MIPYEILVYVWHALIAGGLDLASAARIVYALSQLRGVF